MKRKKRISDACKIHEDFLDNIISNYDKKGEDFGNQKRNSLKLFRLEEKVFNVKSFKIPNFINQIAYRFFRKSKAQRSFEYAKTLESLDIGTPQPIAYYEYKTLFLFKKSYYVSEQLDCEITYRELTKDLNFPDHDRILRAFTRFTFNLHEKGVHFLDHSPGNTLISIENNNYKFFLVDLNRMKFEDLGYEARIRNFAKLATNEGMVRTMSEEYAKCIGADPEDVFEKMWNYTQSFQNRFWRKKRMKKRILFWRGFE